MTTPTPPEPPGGQPVVGHTVELLRGPLEALERWGRTDDALVQGAIAGRQFCLVSGPAQIRQVLAGDRADYRKAELVRENLGTLQGGSLFLLEGEQWRERRQTLQSGFDRGAVQAAGSLTTRYARETVEDWPTEIRADEEMRSLSLAILARALFGLDLHGQQTPLDEAADDILARMNPRTLSVFLPEWVPTPTNYRFRRAVATLHDRIDAVVADASASPGSDGLLSLMLAAGLDPEQVRDELLSLLFAGYDSTATALATTLALVGDRHGVQRRLRAELADTLDGATPTPADLDTLPVLDAVVRESLRLYPPQYAIFREPTERVTLGGYRLDPGTTVVLSPWVCQRDPDHWRAPAQFRPERWLTDRNRPEFAYIPYGGGPRYCLGRGLAEQTIRLVVATVCQRRNLQLKSELSVRAGPTLSLDAVELQARPDPVS